LKDEDELKKKTELTDEEVDKILEEYEWILSGSY